jgi:tetratricopeptide (TPR) repeat protein
MKALLKSIPKPVFRYGLLLIALLVMGVFAFTPLRALNLQARAGRLIEAYVEEHASEYINYFTCQMPALTTLPMDEGLDEAITLLKTARELRPHNAHPYYQLGRAYCLSGDYFSAVVAFDTYNQIRPGNPLGILEKAFAHLSMALTMEELPTHQKLAHEIRSQRILSSQGLTGDYFLEQANSAFRRNAYRAAWYWYRLANAFQPLEEPMAFRTAILDLAYSNETSLMEHLSDEYILQLDESESFLLSDYFTLLDNGSPVSGGEEEEQPIATPTEHPTATPATPTPTPLVFEVCSPLEDETFTTLPQIITDPLDIPPFGQDTVYHGANFTYSQRGDRESIEGIDVYAILSGATVLSLKDESPYGHTLLIETPLANLPDTLQETLLAGYSPVPEDPDYRLYCPDVRPPTITGAFSVYHLYAHMEEHPSLNPGDLVACGEKLGTVGSSGLTEMPRLQLETRLGPSEASFRSLAHFDTTYTIEQLSNYCLWQMSGYYQLFDPFILFDASE